MTNGEDPRLLELGKLADPVLPSTRMREIERLARARFVQEKSAPERTARPREGLVASALVAVLLCGGTLGYLAWTAQTLSALGSLQRGGLLERAGAR